MKTGLVSTSARVLWAGATAVGQAPLGTDFTYQRELKAGGGCHWRAYSLGSGEYQRRWIAKDHIQTWSNLSCCDDSFS